MPRTTRASQQPLLSANASAGSAARARRPSRRSRGRAPRIESIEDVIADLQKRIAQLSEKIDDLMEDEAPVDILVKVFALHGQNASRLGRLLRDQRALSGKAADTIAAAISQALDEIRTEIGADV